MMSRQRVTPILAGVYALVCLVVLGATTLFALNHSQHVGADYTGYASNLVRGQAETLRLRDILEALDDHPNEFHRQQLLGVLNNIRARKRSTRNGLRRHDLAASDYRHLLREFDNIDEQLDTLETLANDALDDPEARSALLETGFALERELAYVYSELHALNQAGAGEQQRLMNRMVVVVIVLTALLLVIIGGLLWALRGLTGQTERLQQLTLTDTLTRLPNRRALLAQVDQALARGTRTGEPVTLALVDVDDFKGINDAYGHPVGDAVLHLLAEHLASLVRAADMTARIGGEEFGFLMPDTDSEHAQPICERIRQSVHELPLPVPDDRRRLSVSIGVATAAPGTVSSFNALYVRADRALYEAKNSGRDRVVVAESSD